MKLEVNLGENSYPIIIENKLIDNLEKYVFKKVFVITNKTVFDIYGSKISSISKKTVVIPDGEKYKNLKTYEYILEELLKAKIERNDTILALGGGVVGDIAGFCASTVLRGVNIIQAPTTLLSQVDSSVGGKTAVNSKCGKNLIGAFKQPKLVLIDPTTLKTLPVREINSGLGEVVKYAFIEKTASSSYDFNFTFLDFLINNDFNKNFDKIISRCCSIKADVVKQDEHEHGLRQILNLGHTFAHAIEEITKYSIHHGEAVTLGIKYAFELSLKLNLIKEDYYTKAFTLIDKVDIGKYSCRIFNSDKMYNYMLNDKKVSNKKISFVLPSACGEVIMKSDIDEILIKEILTSSRFQDYS